MNKEKLVVVIMGQNCRHLIKMCHESVKDADAILFCDGGSNDGTIDYLKKEKFQWEPSNRKKSIIFQHYDQIHPEMNGRQRNYYLNKIKTKYPGWWCLCVDVDEILDTDGIKKIKDFINFLPKENHDMLFSPKMRHLIGNLIHEDSTRPTHFVPNRLFKIRDELSYPEVEHPVLTCPDMRSQNVIITTLWHLAYVPNLWDIKRRYECHLAKSNMHTAEYLENWKDAHMFGEYPKKKFNPIELPDIILDEFGIDKDMFYFNGRREMEIKHYQDAIDWKNYFKCKNAILFGCGFGQRVKTLKQIGVKAMGIELSKYAVHNALDGEVLQCDLLDFEWPKKNDLIVAYDLLEHLKYEDLEKAIVNLINCCKKNILVSVPYKGTPDCDGDPTHIIKEDRAWWVEKFEEKNCKLIETPNHFLFKEQLLIFEVKQ